MNSEFSQLFGSALKYLSYRPRSRAEMLAYLRKKTTDPDLINQTLAKLEKQKLIDDTAFAQWLVQSRSRSRPRGTRLLKQELKTKGIDPLTINNLMTTNNEPALALKALQKKMPIWKKLPYRDFRIKSTRFLSNRGFSWSTIEAAVKKAYNNDDVS